MSRYVYDAEKVESSLDMLSNAKSKLKNTSTEFESALLEVVNASKGYLEISPDVLVAVPEQICSNIDSLASLIEEKEAEIKKYNEASPLDKFFATLGMGVTKFGEGFFSAGEQLLDGGLTIVGWGVGIFSKDAQNGIADFIEKDHVGDFFIDQYENGVLKGINDNSLFSHNSTAANIFKFAGVATGYITATALTGGAFGLASGGGAAAGASAGLNSLAMNMGISAIGGLGEGTEGGLQTGQTFDQASLSGIGQATVQAGTVFVAGKAVDKIFGNGAVPTTATNKGLNVANTSDDVLKLTHASDDIARLPGEVSVPTSTIVDESGKIVGYGPLRNVKFKATDNIDEVITNALGGTTDEAISAVKTAGPVNNVARLPGEVSVPTGTVVDDAGNILGVTVKNVKFSATDNVDDVISNAMNNLGEPVKVPPRLPGEVSVPTGTVVDDAGNVIGVTGKNVKFGATDNVDNIISQAMDDLGRSPSREVAVVNNTTPTVTSTVNPSGPAQLLDEAGHVIGNVDVNITSETIPTLGDRIASIPSAVKGNIAGSAAGSALETPVQIDNNFASNIEVSTPQESIVQINENPEVPTPTPPAGDVPTTPPPSAPQSSSPGVVGYSNAGSNISTQARVETVPTDNSSISTPENNLPSDTVSEPEPSVPEEPPIDEDISTSEPSTPEEPPTTPSDNTSSSGNTNNGSISSPPPVNNNNNNNPVINTPSNNYQSSGQTITNHYATANNDQISTPEITESTNITETTPSAPESDTNISSNVGEELDVISIDRGNKPSSASNESNDGGNVVPTILGVGVAGAAAVAGAKYIKDKKESENTYEEDLDDDFSLSYQENENNDATTLNEPKYKAGSVNKLSLDESDDVYIYDDNNIASSKEELE